MEEKKKNPTGAAAPSNGGTQGQKLTYEQLNDACQQLFQQNQYLVRQLKEANMTNVFRRLDYLFKVVDNHHVFDEDFVDQCVHEIQEALTPRSDKEGEAS